MIYARAHDKTVAEDYFAAMQTEVFQLIEQLELPELCMEARLGIVTQLRHALSNANEHAPPILHD